MKVRFSIHIFNNGKPNDHCIRHFKGPYLNFFSFEKKQS